VTRLAEPAETSALRGKKRHAKTDRADARWLRTLLAEGRLPEAWIAPAHVREWRTQTRLRKTLIDERICWVQRIQATLFHHGIAEVPDQLLRTNGRAFLRSLSLPPAGLQRIEIALAIIDEIERQLGPLERELARLARRQVGCQALMRHYGVGPVTATTVLCELGDVPACQPRARRCAAAAWTSACTARTVAHGPAGSPAKAHPPCAGRSTKPPNAPASPPAPTTPTTSRSKPADSPTPAPR